MHWGRAGKGGMAMPAAAAFVAVTALFACFSFAVPATGSRAPDLSVEGTNEAAAPGWQRVWQQVQQQRLCRFTALMQDLSSAPALVAELTWYASTQRPLFAAQDMQQILQANRHAAGLDDNDGGLQYIAQDLFDFGSRGSSSGNDMTVPGQGQPLLMHTLPAGSVTANSATRLAANSDTAAALLAAPMDDMVGDALSDSETEQLDDALTTDLTSITEQLNNAQSAAAVSTEYGEEYLPYASRRSRRLKVATSDTNSGSSSAPDFSWLLTDLTGSVGVDGSAISIRDLPLDGVPAAGDMTTSPALLIHQQKPPSQQDFRIVGGVEAPQNRYPWVCSMRASNDFHYCGCSLIAPSVVMSAGHCLDQTDPALKEPWVELGRYYLNGANTTTNGYERIKCTKSVVHPGWSFNIGLNDVSLCFLASESRFTPVKLAAVGSVLAPSTPVTVMGWGAQSEGATNAPKLMQVNVDVTSLDSCNTTYQGALRDKQICAGVPEGGADACQGDSGGPLILPGENATTDVQVGIVSYGVGCGRPNTPGVYTDVSKYRGFIADTLLQNGVTYPPVTSLTASLPTVTASQDAASSSGGSGGASQDAVSKSDGSTAAAVPTSSSSSTTSSGDVCACSTDGYSGNTYVGRTLTGCKQHGLDFGDTSYYCYAEGGAGCTAATASNSYPGAYWLSCDPASQSQVTPATSTSSLASGWVQALQSWISFNAANNTNSSAGNSSVPNAQTKEATQPALRTAGGLLG